MNLDGTTIGALLGFFGLIVTAISGVYIAGRANKTEKASTAMKALEDTRDEAYAARLTLRDEQIAKLRLDLSERKSSIEGLREEIRQLKR